MRRRLPMALRRQTDADEQRVDRVQDEASALPPWTRRLPSGNGGAKPRVEFTDDQIERYSRHIILPEVGGDGQRKLFAAKALIIGAGGLGSPAGLYLAAAGVGTIGIVDSDAVELSNLQRQVLHATSCLGRAKCLSAKDTMEAQTLTCG